ncbi:glutathione peroxidase [Prolixibacteraceae bacterium JC049]|nr:glutathione peroxidase [Prolixibacteraceae bacterium JC049]
MKLLFIISLFVSFSLATFASGNLHQFTVKDIHGNDYSLKQLKGKKVMVVNTASKCGLTPQYKILEKIYRQYKDKGFVIVAFPSNDFMKQEPGSNKEILDFCTSEFDISFPIMSKISVKGKKMHPLYEWLTKKSKNGKADAPVRWNFHKYLIDEKGNFVKSVPPSTMPDDEDVIKWITQ